MAVAARAGVAPLLLRLAAARLPYGLHALHGLSVVTPTFAILLLQIMVTDGKLGASFAWGAAAFAAGMLNVVLILVICHRLRQLPPPQ